MTTQVHAPVYATQALPLQQQIEQLLKGEAGEAVEGEILAIVVPNTNLLSAGPAAAAAYKQLRGHAYDTIVIIAPSKAGRIGRINIARVDRYASPLGAVPVNDGIRNEMCDEEDDIFIDDLGHYQAEGVDVQVPFLQTVLGDGFDVVPIVMGDESPAFCRELGGTISEVMYNRRTLIVACVDLMGGDAEHVENLRTLIETVDVSRSMSLLNSGAVQMEGSGPLLVAMIAAQQRHCSGSKVLHLQPSQEGEPGAISAILWRA